MLGEGQLFKMKRPTSHREININKYFSELNYYYEKHK